MPGQEPSFTGSVETSSSIYSALLFCCCFSRASSCLCSFRCTSCSRHTAPLRDTKKTRRASRAKIPPQIVYSTPSPTASYLQELERRARSRSDTHLHRGTDLCYDEACEASETRVHGNRTDGPTRIRIDLQWEAVNIHCIDALPIILAM